MSQETLAEHLGVTFQQVQKYEKGANRIAATRLHAIAAALDAPIMRFFDGLSPMRGKRQEDAHDLDAALAQPGAAEMLRMFASVRSDKVRRRLLELVRAMTQDN